jgi:glycosyltransferase involved in cell wall biosynthesis
MKVKVVFTSSYPVGAVSTHRIHNICKGLNLSGAELELLLVYATERKNDIRNTHRLGMFEEVRYRYIPRDIKRFNSRFLQKIRDYACVVKLFIILFLERKTYENVIVIGPSLDFRIFIPIVCRLLTKKVYIEINELPFVTTLDTLAGKIKYKLFRLGVLPNYDGSIVISEALRLYVLNTVNDSHRIIKIPILATPSDKKFVKDTNRPIEQKYLFHAGSLLEEKDGILSVLRAFAIVKDSVPYPIKYIFTGILENSPQKREIKYLINHLNLENDIIFVGYLSSEDLNRYLNFANLAVVYKRKNLQNEYCFATKITEYINFSIPIVTTNVGEAAYYIKSDLNGYIVGPDNIEELTNAIEFALLNESESARISKNALKLLDNEFNIEVQGRRLLEFLSEAN